MSNAKNTTRLTNMLRAAIVKKAIQQSFAKREDELKKAQHALADAIYKHFYAAEAALVAKIPQDWKVFTSTMYISHDGFTYRHSGNDNLPDRTLEMSEARPVPPQRGQLNLTGKLDAAANKYSRDWVKLKKDREEAEAKATAILSSVSTVARLLEIWPEAKAFVPEPQVVAMLPANPAMINEVNKLLRLAA